MTKADIVDRVCESVGGPKKDCIEVVEAVFELLKATLEKGEPIKISGFGNFLVKQKSDRTGRNPQTGEAITISKRRVLTFKPSMILKGEINKK